jgi:hypothetical protein
LLIMLTMAKLLPCWSMLCTLHARHSSTTLRSTIWYQSVTIGAQSKFKMTFKLQLQSKKEENYLLKIINFHCWLQMLHVCHTIQLRVQNCRILKKNLV